MASTTDAAPQSSRRDDAPQDPPAISLVTAPAAPVAEATQRVVRHRALVAATVAAGVAMGLLVGHDGTPGWHVVRVAAVLTIVALLLAMEALAGDRVCGRVVAATGVTVIAVAVGFGPFVVKAPSTPQAVAGAVAMLAGVLLAASGSVLSTRGRRMWWRAAIGVGTLMAAAAVAFVVGPAVAATNVPRPPIGATPADRGLAYGSVTLTTSDDVPLAGWYVPSTNGAAVVLLHGAGSTRSEVLEQAVVLHRHGFGVLMVDARGHGDSGGRAMDFGWQGDADIAAATAFLASQPDIEPYRIGAVGLSMGGEEAVGASGSNDLIRAVVAEGVTARTAADEAWLSDEFGWRGLVQEQLERVQDVVADALTSASVPTSLRAAVAASGDTKYLLVTAGNVADEGPAAAYVASGAPDRVQVWTVPGAGHTRGLATDPAAWEARVIAFLDGALGNHR